MDPKDKKENPERVDIKAALDELKATFDAAIADRTKAIQDKADADVKKANEAIEVIQAEAKEFQKQLDALDLKQKEQPNGPAKVKSIGEQVYESLEKNKDIIEQFAKDPTKAFRIKAAALMDTSIFGAGVNQGLRETGVNMAPMRRRFVLSNNPIVRVINGGAGSNPLTWVEWRPKEGGPAPTAESASKPLMDWTYQIGTANAKTIAVLAYVTKQSLLNRAQFADEVNNELLVNLADELDYQALLGDNTGENLNGINTIAKTFTGAGLAGEVQDANIFDVIRAGILQVRKGNKATTGYGRRTGFLPNYVLISPDRAAEMDLTKDANGQYILPPFSTQDGQIIKGVRVIDNDFLDADDFLIGDFSTALFNFVEGITLESGYINDQFAKNQMTIRAEVEGMIRVKYHDTWAFVKGDFTTAKALIAATT